MPDEQSVAGLQRRLRAATAQLSRVRALTVDTDGNQLDPDVSFPVGELMRVLAEGSPQVTEEQAAGDDRWVYFVSYAHRYGFGQLKITCLQEVTDHRAVIEFHRTIQRTSPSAIDVVVLNFILLSGPGGAARSAVVSEAQHAENGEVR